MRAIRRTEGLLVEARDASRERTRLLTELAEGTRRLTDGERRELVEREANIARLLDEIAGSTVRRLRVVSSEELDGLGEKSLPPRALLEVYERVVWAAYGTDPAVRAGRAETVAGAGRRVTRTSTSTPEGVGGRASPPSRRAGASTRSVVRDRRAYELKLRIDRRLRRIGSEAASELDGGDGAGGGRVRVCSRCARIAESEWRWCPWCGSETREVEEGD